ncbi:receptor-like protein EIX2, partial [Neltuma alba]|uniref:receptor-like protein EIX2 n=1 Tax=Neltuma alba TaxID=207710 RepID=UPI0010A5516D
MSSNKFEGRLPRVSNWVQALDLSYNSFSGPLYTLLCHSETNQTDLEYLDLSNNYLTQELPDCWNNWRSLFYIYLGNNQLTGRVPPMMGSSLPDLRALDLHNNGFSGDIPSTFNNCKSLLLLNLEANNFSGDIQAWMPQDISIVKLRSNQFTGNIPLQLCRLFKLMVLDLANNELSGSIPHCLHNTTSLSLRDLEHVLHVQPSHYELPSRDEFMKIDLHTKGQQLEYQKNLKLVRSIDLSANRLSGEIPMQLFKLTELQSLNLSYNYLIGEIPKHIGEMKNLESLDLSHNNLHGNIPQSMSGLSFLSVLNLSYNHFSGQIPLGTQLQSFDAWSYAGNPDLCGPPLQKHCTIPDNTEKVEENEDDGFLKSLYLGMGVGFAVGFWVVCGSLVLNRAWRHSYFRFFNGVVDRIYVILAIKLQ